MIRWLSGVALAALATGALGWSLAELPRAEEAAPETRSDWTIVHAGADLAAVMDAYDGALFAGVTAEAPAPIVAPVPVATRPAPAARVVAQRPPDIAQQFRDSLSAIVETGGARGVWMVDPRQGRRFVRVGGVFKDGWRIAAIGPNAVTLSRGRERRRVNVFAMPYGADTPMISAVASQNEAAPIAPNETPQGALVPPVATQPEPPGARNRITRPRQQGSTP